VVPEDRAQKAEQRPHAPGLSQLLRGSLVTQLIYVAATLGVADLLDDSPKSSRELAAALGVDPEALYRVLRALASSSGNTDLVELADLRPGERVLDVAAALEWWSGSRRNKSARQVRSPAWISTRGCCEWRDRFQALPGTPVTWVEGSALAMPLPDASFDVALCQQGVPFFPDQRAGLQEVKRSSVCSSRGAGCSSAFWEGETPYTVAMAAAVERHAGLEAATTLRKSRACPGPETLQYLMKQIGFRNTTIRARTIMRGLPAAFDGRVRG